MEEQAVGEEALHLAGAVATIIVGDIALGRDDQGVGDEAKHGDDASDDGEDAVVGDTDSLQYNTHGK